ncbi:MAG: hypothetical protein AAF851_22400, partial [Myxococcota bacterium]
ASAAETWKLPPPSKPNATLSVKVRVAKGRRFKLLTPKEQAQAAADAQRRAAEAASKEDEGFVNVGTFLPSGW